MKDDIYKENCTEGQNAMFLPKMYYINAKMFDGFLFRSSLSRSAKEDQSMDLVKRFPISIESLTSASIH